MSYIDWNAGQEAATAYGTETANANAMLDQSLRLRALNALHGYNANNPDSVNASVNALGGLGMFEQASAASNLAKTSAINRAITSEVPGAMSSDQQQPETQQQVQLHENMLTDSAAILDHIMSIKDPQQRQQAVQEGKDYFSKQYNVSGDDIDQEMGDFSNNTSLMAHRAEIQRQLDTYAAAHQAGVQGSLAQLEKWSRMPAPLVGAFQAAGADPTPALQVATNLTQGLRGIAAAGPTAQASEVGRNIGAAGTAPQIAAAAGAQSGGTAAGQAPYGAVTINMGDGSTIQAHAVTGANGQVTWKQIEPTPAGAPAAAASGGGAPAAANNTGFGAAPSPQRQGIYNASGQQLVADRATAAQLGQTITPLRQVINKLPDTNIGPGTEQTNELRSFVIAQLPWLTKLDPKGWDAAKIQTANYNELKKYMAQIATTGLNAAFGAGSDARYAGILSGNPHITMDKLSATQVTELAVGAARAQAAAPLLFDQTGQDPGQYSQWKSNWGASVDPRGFMLDVMSKADRQKMLAAIPTGSNEAKAIKKARNDAEQAGFFQDSDIPR
jgi:hypothetical protein